MFVKLNSSLSRFGGLIDVLFKFICCEKVKNVNIFTNKWEKCGLFQINAVRNLFLPVIFHERLSNITSVYATFPNIFTLFSAGMISTLHDGGRA